MTLQLERDLVVLDLETTGTEPSLDRIVQIALVRLSPDGSVSEFQTLVNPEIAIPIEATRVHGITDKMVKDAPLFRTIATDIRYSLTNADLCGFNLIRFDLPLLKAEFRRAGVMWDMNGTKVIDVQKIFHQRERRDLSAACKFFCGREHEDAHGALADARITYEILLSQLVFYEDLPKDVAGLHAESNRVDPRYVDSDRRFYWRHREATFGFGKLQGHSLREVARNKADYLAWMLNQDFSSEVRKIVTDALRGVFPVAPPLDESEVAR